jgi:fructose-1,6-bisphosphatase/inositol monophosphatase family enzyme
VSGLPAAKSGASALDVARKAAETAAEIMLAAYQTPIEKETKSRGNFLTKVDLACEGATLELLSAEYPDMPVLAEETSATVGDWKSGWLWVVDPIDGTSNFARGIPTFCFNIALCRDGEPVLGLTQQPVTGDEFVAVAGEGLTVGGSPSRVSEAATMSDALTGFGLGYSYERSGLMLGILADLWPGFLHVQNIGSAALGLAYAASGRFDLYVHAMLAPWDMAAGLVQIREAGGLVLDRAGGHATIFSEGLAAGAPGPVREFIAATKDRRWR